MIVEPSFASSTKLPTVVSKNLASYIPSPFETAGVLVTTEFESVKSRLKLSLIEVVIKFL